MAREYHHIQDYEKEILELKSQGYTLRAIGEKFVINSAKRQFEFGKHGRFLPFLLAKRTKEKHLHV